MELALHCIKSPLGLMIFLHTHIILVSVQKIGEPSNKKSPEKGGEGSRRIQMLYAEYITLLLTPPVLLE